jgi:hypothetical protein
LPKTHSPRGDWSATLQPFVVEEGARTVNAILFLDVALEV